MMFEHQSLMRQRCNLFLIQYFFILLLKMGAIWNIRYCLVLSRKRLEFFHISAFSLLFPSNSNSHHYQRPSPHTSRIVHILQSSRLVSLYRPPSSKKIDADWQSRDLASA
jgi:hypothetical protein